MKFVIALFAIIGLTTSAPPLTLETDLLQFLELIPLEDIQRIINKHLKNDKGFQAAIQYLQGDQWGAIADDLQNLEESKNIDNYLRDAGLDLNYMMAIMEEMLGDVNIKTHHNKASVKKFIEELRAILPYQELLALYQDKIANSKPFQDFIDKLTSERFHLLIENLLATEPAQKALDGLESIELTIKNYIKAIYAFIGWKGSKYV